MTDSPFKIQRAAETGPMVKFVIFDANGERTLKIKVSGSLKIGKMSSSHVQMEGNGISRMHAVIEHRVNGRFYIMDLGGADGTWVNQKKVNSGELNSGDQVSIGREFGFQFFCGKDALDDGETESTAQETPPREPPQDPRDARIKELEEKLKGVSLLARQQQKALTYYEDTLAIIITAFLTSFVAGEEPASEDATEKKDGLGSLEVFVELLKQTPLFSLKEDESALGELLKKIFSK